MPLEIVRGDVNDPLITRDLTQTLEGGDLQGTLYLGYPVVAADGDPVRIDALLATRQTGLVAIQCCRTPVDEASWDEIVQDQDALYRVFNAQLSKQTVLSRGRKMVMDLVTLSVFPEASLTKTPEDAEGLYCDIAHLTQVVGDLPGVTNDTFQRIQAALQHVSNMKPKKKRANVSRPDSKGAMLKEMEASIANMDKWQKRAAIETVEGPQRIRGLAGSGKTIVLAHKAAYLHARNPEWNIALTFQSRALYQQFEDLVQRFTFDQIDDKFDEDKLHIAHSWGGQRAGVYTMIADRLGVTPYSWVRARDKFGYDGAFSGACRELLEAARAVQVDPLFDAVLIDEAQDLPAEFFQLVYLFTKPPHRVIWAYDEMQRLSETEMPSLEEMFGTLDDGTPRVTLANRDSSAKEDVVLPICYRNSPWAIATAHALGFGIYRSSGLVQHFDDPDMWQRIGYRVSQGALDPGALVDLVRDEESIPPYFRELTPSQTLSCELYQNVQLQDARLAEIVASMLENDEVDADDILIVLPEPRYFKKRGQQIRDALLEEGVSAHLVGVTSSTDEVFKKGSIAIAHIYRAKGNEAPIVFVPDANEAMSAINPVKNRNVLFTSITRSRAWVYLMGHSVDGDRLVDEFGELQRNQFHLKLKIPTPAELAKIRAVNRERSSNEERVLRNNARSMEALIAEMADSDQSLDSLSPEIRQWLIDNLKQ